MFSILFVSLYANMTDCTSVYCRTTLLYGFTGIAAAFGTTVGNSRTERKLKLTGIVRNVISFIACKKVKP